MIIHMNDHSVMNLDTDNIDARGNGINIEVYNGSLVDVQTQDLNTTEDGIYVESNMNINGNADSTVIIKTDDITSDGDGIGIRAYNTDTTIAIDGKIESKSSGLNINQAYDGSITATVKGDIEAHDAGIDLYLDHGTNAGIKAGTIHGGTGIDLISGTANEKGSEVTIEADDIFAKSTGVSLTNYYEGKTTATINGSITAGTDADNTGYGLYTQTEDNAVQDITIHGDVTYGKTDVTRQRWQ